MIQNSSFPLPRSSHPLWGCFSYFPQEPNSPEYLVKPWLILLPFPILNREAPRSAWLRSVGLGRGRLAGTTSWATNTWRNRAGNPNQWEPRSPPQGLKARWAGSWVGPTLLCLQHLDGWTEKPLPELEEGGHQRWGKQPRVLEQRGKRGQGTLLRGR